MLPSTPAQRSSRSTSAALSSPRARSACAHSDMNVARMPRSRVWPRSAGGSAPQPVRGCYAAPETLPPPESLCTLHGPQCTVTSRCVDDIGAKQRGAQSKAEGPRSRRLLVCLAWDLSSPTQSSRAFLLARPLSTVIITCIFISLPAAAQLSRGGSFTEHHSARAQRGRDTHTPLVVIKRISYLSLKAASARACADALARAILSSRCDRASALAPPAAAAARDRRAATARAPAEPDGNTDGTLFTLRAPPRQAHAPRP